MDKNKAIIDYLIQCPQILNSPLYFNFINAENDTAQIITTAEDISVRRTYIDGSRPRRFTFNILLFKTIADIAIVKAAGYDNENVDDMSDVQDLIDWINEQSEAHNYPDFGEDCIVDDIQTTTATPRLDGVNTEITPPLAMYTVSIIVDYIDISRKLWE